MKKRRTTTQNILWFTWKDMTHPAAGGAELLNEEIIRRLAARGYKVTLIVGGYTNCTHKSKKDGYTIIRVGSKYTVYFAAWRYARKHLKHWPDIVIDEINVMPFFARLYMRRPTYLFVHQLARKVWFYEMPKILGLIGYLAEPLYLFMLRTSRVITVSNSTRSDLMKYGFKRENIDIISEGLSIAPIRSIASITKRSAPTLLSLGHFRPMKRTLEHIELFDMSKARIPNLQLIIAGDSQSSYGRKVLERIEASPYSDDITYMGLSLIHI